ncbi:MAG TPA: hypothetical protein VGQ57_08275 [Polyangiaceae bacterium]|jgi:hypothetical protein|nr:hypothetical protein [Polyangiaceae bacterium]
MNDLKAMLVAALIITPAACHDEPAPKTPEKGTAGAYEVAPAPSTTPEPSPADSPKLDAPKLNESPRQTDPTGTAPIHGSYSPDRPYEIAQPTGGTSQGGFGGTTSAGSGGSIITSRN